MKTIQSLLFVVILMFSATYCQPDHITESIKGWKYASIDSSEMLKRIIEAAQENEHYKDIPRYTNYDYALPADSAEYYELDKNAILMVAAITHTQDELPIKSVSIKIKGNRNELKKVAETKIIINNELVNTLFGTFNAVSYYLLPMKYFGKKSIITLDWNKNRSDFELGNLDNSPELPAFKKDKKKNDQSGNVNINMLKEFLEREYNLRQKKP